MKKNAIATYYAFIGFFGWAALTIVVFTMYILPNGGI